MKLAEIIRETGLNPCSFKTSDITIHLYDGKDRIVEGDVVSFNEPLFIQNEDSLRNFEIFIKGLEEEAIKDINVKIDISCVVLFYKTPRAIAFMRIPTMDPLDYMD